MFVGNSVFLLLAAATVSVLSRPVNLTTSWVLPQEGFPHFLRYFKEAVTWDDAKAVCGSYGGQLVTVETAERREAVKSLLKELEVVSYVWSGLERISSDTPFVWTGGGQNALQDEDSELVWQEPPPTWPERLCVRLLPEQELRWQATECDQERPFICQLEVPDWATGPEGCISSFIPSVTITYLPEPDSPGVIQLNSDCGLAGTRTIACKGSQNQEELIKKLSCDIEITGWSWTPRAITSEVTRNWGSSGTRHKRDSTSTATYTDSPADTRDTTTAPTKSKVRTTTDKPVKETPEPSEAKKSVEESFFPAASIEDTPIILDKHTAKKFPPTEETETTRIAETSTAPSTTTTLAAKPADLTTSKVVISHMPHPPLMQRRQNQIVSSTPTSTATTTLQVTENNDLTEIITDAATENNDVVLVEEVNSLKVINVEESKVADDATKKPVEEESETVRIIAERPDESSMDFEGGIRISEIVITETSNSREDKGTVVEKIDSGKGEIEVIAPAESVSSGTDPYVIVEQPIDLIRQQMELVEIPVEPSPKTAQEVAVVASTTEKAPIAVDVKPLELAAPQPSESKTDEPARTEDPQIDDQTVDIDAQPTNVINGLDNTARLVENPIEIVDQTISEKITSSVEKPVVMLENTVQTGMPTEAVHETEITNRPVVQPANPDAEQTPSTTINPIQKMTTQNRPTEHIETTAHDTEEAVERHETIPPTYEETSELSISTLKTETVEITETKPIEVKLPDGTAPFSTPNPLQEQHPTTLPSQNSSLEKIPSTHNNQPDTTMTTSQRLLPRVTTTAPSGSEVTTPDAEVREEKHISSYHPADASEKEEGSEYSSEEAQSQPAATKRNGRGRGLYHPAGPLSFYPYFLSKVLG